MFTRFRNFLYRHRRKLIISGAVVGGVVLAVRYAERKFIEWQDKETKEFLDKTRKLHHFQSTERTCNQTIISLSVRLKEQIIKIVDTEELLSKLREKGDSKLKLWEELKIKAFVQHSALLYSGLLLVLVLRIQLNIIGGYISQESTLNGTLDPFIQESYLNLCQHFIKEGVKDICTIVEKHVNRILTDVSLRKQVSLQELEHIFWSIQAGISCDPLNPIRNLSKYLFPPQEEIETRINANNRLKKMVTETLDLLDTEGVVSLANLCLSQGYSNSLDRIAEYFTPGKDPSPSNGPTFTNIHNITMPMAKIVPIVHGLANPISTETDTETWIHQFIIAEKINTFGANLYEVFSYPSTK